jgi:hypothetical protein
MRHNTHHAGVTTAALLLVLVSAIGGCDSGEKAVGGGRTEPLAAFLHNVQSASSPTLYEGLPHQVWESDALKEELARKRTVKLHGFSFYDETWVIEPQIATTLKAVLTQAGALRAPPTGVVSEKQCGGFHPDYAIRWTADGRTYEVLICLGCEEAWCYGQDGELRCDISEAALRELKAALTPYQRNRPRKQPASAA